MPTPGPFRYSLAHLIYAVTYLATSLATFGVGGIVPGIFFLAGWAYVFSQDNRPRALGYALTVLVLGICGCGFLLPAVRLPRDAARRSVCLGQLKQIQLALQNYHDTYDCFPPAYFADESGRPIHSWRVLLLPFVEEKSLYDKYSFDEPWDGPNNMKLHATIPNIYRCPADTSRRSGLNAPYTSYFAIVGDDTAWLGPTSRRIGDFTGGTSNTVMVAESPGRQVHWMEPWDLDLDTIVRELTPKQLGPHEGHRSEDFFYEYDALRHVAVVDGSVHTLIVCPHPEAIAPWFTLAKPDTWRDLNLDFNIVQGYAPRFRWDNLLRLVIWICLTLWPLGWIRRKRGPQNSPLVPVVLAS